MEKMKKLIMMFAAGAFALQSFADTATVEVSSVAELTNAVAMVNAKTKVGGNTIGTIILKKSGSPYVFNDEYMNINTSTTPATTNLIYVVEKVVIKGEDESSRTNWTYNAEPVIINGNGKGRIFYSHFQYLSLYNLTLTGGSTLANANAAHGGAAFFPNNEGMERMVVSNCVFRQNTAYDYGAAKNMSLYDCCVTNCSGTHFGAFWGDARNCDFVGNDGGVASNSRFYDCRFVDNRLWAGDGRDNDMIINGTYCLSNCVVESNSGWGIVGCRESAVVADSIFRGNTSGDGCVLANPGTGGVTRCVFEDNGGSRRGGAICLRANGWHAVVDGCTFRRNSCEGDSTYNYGGGAILMIRTPTQLCSMAVTNCVFEGNVSRWSYAWSPSSPYWMDGGAICNYTPTLPAGENPWDSLEVYGCTFSNNFANLSVGGVCGVKAIRCKFKDNMRDYFSLPDERAFLNDVRQGGEARASYLVDCDISGGELMDCIVDRCDIHDICDSCSTNAICIFREFTRVTNSIVRNVSLREGVVGRAIYLANKTLDAEFVNCTFVTNLTSTMSFTPKITTTNKVDFANCLFYGNRGKYSVSDVLLDSAGGYPLWGEKVSFVNSYYGNYKAGNNWANTAPNVFADKTGENKLMQCAEPKFVCQDARTMEKYPDAPLWSLSLQSPLLGMGDPLDFTADDLDLAGRPRLREDGAIDVGCYQCWIRPKQSGFKLLFR